jgi:hypothetical protein
MRTAFSFFLALLALQAQAASFDNRLAHADNVCAAPNSEAYLQLVYARLSQVSTKILMDCFGSIAVTDKSGFVVVGNINASGKLSDVATRPDTNLAACFAHAIKAVTFAAPPEGRYQNKFPVVFNMDAVPVKSSFKLKCL